ELLPVARRAIGKATDAGDAPSVLHVGVSGAARAPVAALAPRVSRPREGRAAQPASWSRRRVLRLSRLRRGRRPPLRRLEHLRSSGPAARQALRRRGGPVP